MSGVLHPAFAFHHRNSIASAGLGKVKITRTISKGTWSPDGTTADVIEEIYLGRARVQKTASPTSREFVDDTAKFQKMRVQLAFEDNELPTGRDFEVQVNDRVEVILNASDPAQVGEQYYVHGTASSSNAWNRTLMCQSNMKQE